ncbi:MAG: thiosulfate/3-mercaptopyruvate sulfurtransferase [Halioglobus sp.]|jgi:thiosulfate/3-mercaptopyruvate sulfurtransferase
MLLEPKALLGDHSYRVFDCRFSLADPGEGLSQYEKGHVPGAYYLDLNRDLASPPQEHGGRHPLPDPELFAAMLAGYGVGPETEVVAYDDSRFGFAARLWWMMRSLGYTPPRLLNGGYRGFLLAGGEPETVVPEASPIEVAAGAVFSGSCDIEGLGEAQEQGALLVDSREARRYEGLEEPIDPVAGHIPGAINRPWQGITDDDARAQGNEYLQQHWGDALNAEKLVVYCGSGVTACVNLFSLALLGREDATLYAGSWSDWCSYLEVRELEV